MAYRSTSRAARTSFAAHSKKLDDLIIEALDAAARDGLICQEIETVIAREHQAVSANLRHLVERGRVMETALRGVTRSGRSAIKWVLARHYTPAVNDPLFAAS